MAKERFYCRVILALSYNTHGWTIRTQGDLKTSWFVENETTCVHLHVLQLVIKMNCVKSVNQTQMIITQSYSTNDWVITIKTRPLVLSDQFQKFRLHARVRPYVLHFFSNFN